MSLRFHPVKNIHEDASKMMRIIHEAKFGLKITLRNNDAIRVEERDRMADKTIIFSSDDNSDSEQAKYHPNQRRHLIKHPHFHLNAILIIKKQPLKKPMLDHGNKKKKF